MLNGDPVDYHIYSSPLSPNTVAVDFLMVIWYPSWWISIAIQVEKANFSETVIADIV